MGDYLYYVAANGRIVKRDYKSVAELEAEIDRLPEGDEDETLDKALERARSRASLGMRVQYAGVNAARRVLSALSSPHAAAMEALAELPDGSVGAEFERGHKKKVLLSLWLEEQASLKQRWLDQRKGDFAKEAEKSRLRVAAEKIARDAATAAVRAGWKAVVKKRKKKGSES